tara:strand:+ start:1855 stop:2289 length:435 start_codon:yes stop_codon:yes gene_type:complete
LKPAHRRKARRFAIQAIYQWQLAGGEINDIQAQYMADNDTSTFDVEYFNGLVRGVLTQLNEIDTIIGPFLDREINGVDPIERAILRVSTYEMKHHLDVPYRVVINEAIELAKIFGATDGHKYVNGVMDKLPATLRSVEYNANKR